LLKVCVLEKQEDSTADNGMFELFLPNLLEKRKVNEHAAQSSFVNGNQPHHSRTRGGT
jgi:hypothetical protein